MSMASSIITIIIQAPAGHALGVPVLLNSYKLCIHETNYSHLLNANKLSLFTTVHIRQTH